MIQRSRRPGGQHRRVVGRLAVGVGDAGIERPVEVELIALRVVDQDFLFACVPEDEQAEVDEIFGLDVVDLDKRPELPHNLIMLVDDCLAIDPTKRPQSAREFLARIDGAMKALNRRETVSFST